MGIHFSVKNRKRSIDYLFVDDVSVDCYENALFRINFRYDSLKKEQVEIVNEYLEAVMGNLLEVLNGEDNSSETHGSHEDRLKLLENEIATLTNVINSQIPLHGTLKITPSTSNMDFNQEGTMLKFTNRDNGVFTTGILQNGVETEITLPVGEYTVNIVNSLNDITDSVFLELWETATSEDNNHTMVYNVVEGVTEISTLLEYENIADNELGL